MTPARQAERSPITVAAPASKSLSHRAVIAAALASGTSCLGKVLESDDITRTMDVLRACGASITREAPGAFAVSGVAGRIAGGTGASPLSCFMGESGTSCRLLTAVLAAGTGVFRVHGEGRLHERPMKPLTDILERLGVSFRYEGVAGFLPFLMRTSGLALGKAASARGNADSARGNADSEWLPVPGEISSQFLSGLLLAAPLAQGGLGLAPAGKKVVSWPYVGLTLRTMEDFGRSFAVEVRDGGEAWAAVEDWRAVTNPEPGRVRIRVAPGPYQSRDLEVEGDYSGASYLLAAGALGPRPVTVTGLRRASPQGDAVILDILENMGASVAWSAEGVTVSPAPLRGVSRDMGNCPDIVPTVAVLAAHAAGPTELRNIAHLRAKESDRVEALVSELARAGVTAHASGDALVVEPARCRPSGEIRFSSHDDHRMAMALALFELDGADIRLDNAGCVSKSFPDFWITWKRICPGPAAELQS